MWPVALAFHLDDFGVGKEAVEDCGGGRGVSEKLAPVFGGSIGGDDDRAQLMSADEDFEQVFGGSGAEFLHAEVFEDQQVSVTQFSDELSALVDVPHLGFGAAADVGATGPRRSLQREQFLDLFEREPQRLRFLDEADALDGLFRVCPVV